MLCLILLALVLQISAKQGSNKATKHSNFQDCRYFVNPKLQPLGQLMHVFGMPFAFNLSRLFVYYWIGGDN
jgi:hypothetical protein